MNGWICADGVGRLQIASFGDGTVYYFYAPDGAFTVGMNVTFTPIKGSGCITATDVVWDGTYSKPGANGLFCGVKI